MVIWRCSTAKSGYQTSNSYTASTQVRPIEIRNLLTPYIEKYKAFMCKYFRLFTLFLSLSLGLTLPPQLACAETEAIAPDVVSAKFYKWYLHALSTDEEPLINDKACLANYVSKALMSELEARMQSEEGLDADYFIKAQDYLDDWEENISTQIQPVKGSMKEVVVTLGATQESLHRLSVTLVREGNDWKIRKIKKLNAQK